MKRDMDLVLRILLEIENKKNVNGWIKISYEDFNDEEVSYHIMLLNQANLIEATDLSTKDKFHWSAIYLTWEGHEFLDNARNNKIWTKMKKFIGEKATTISFDLIKELLILFTKEELNLSN